MTTIRYLIATTPFPREVLEYGAERVEQCGSLHLVAVPHDYATCLLLRFVELDAAAVFEIHKSLSGVRRRAFLLLTQQEQQQVLAHHVDVAHACVDLMRSQRAHEDNNFLERLLHQPVS